MQVGVDVAVHHRHRLRTRRPDADELDVHQVAQPPQHRRRPVGAGGDPDRAVAAGRGRPDGVRAIHLAEGRQRDRGVGDGTFQSVAGCRRPLGSVALPQRDVHRPVVAADGEFPGSVQRVDDPHPVGVHPRQVVDSLLGQHRVGGAFARKAVQDQPVGPFVARVAEVVGIPEADLVANLEQQLTGVAGQLSGQRGIGSAHHSSIAE